MKKSRRIMALLLLLSVFASCTGQQQDAGNIIEVEDGVLEMEQTTVAERGDIEKSILIPGYVAPKVYQLKFEQQGIFEEYKVELGEEVSKGQVLATLNGVEVKKKVRELEQKIAQMDGDYTYQTTYIDKTIEAYQVEMNGYYVKLKDEKNPLGAEEYSQVCMELGIREVSIKQEELKKAQLKQTYELDRAHLAVQLKEEKEKLNENSILSPCDGVVIAIQDMSQEINTRADYYYVAVAEKDVYYLRSQYMEQVYADSMIRAVGLKSGKEYELSYVPMDNDLYMELKNSGEKMFSHFEITAPDEMVHLGDEMTLKLVISERTDVLVVPNLAVDGDAAGWYVYKKTPEGKEKVYVTTGFTNQIMIEITSGLEEGDVVYVPK